MEAKNGNGDIKRCPWCGTDPLYTEYHDREWGRLATDDRTLFEFLILEGAQAGLSWITVLRKREAYREAFAGFDPAKVAAFTDDDVNCLMNNPGIIRNRLKITSAVKNARLFLDICREFGSFNAYVLGFFAGAVPVVNDVPDSWTGACRNEVSDALSKDLKKRGFNFVGSVICYSFLQATGYIDDHENGCAFKSPR
ncbi:MAG: DNA-3-methyladenine glycosylase I [Rikenellaceae bacterium]|nr:DNA-3-methyladenine glycosylase I [Rikenellaceae bacterium]